MSMILTYFGGAPETFAADLKNLNNWRTLTTANAGFAFLPDERSDIGEQTIFFSSPDSRCVGVFSGKLFNATTLMSSIDSQLKPEQRLGLLFQQLYAKHGAGFAIKLYGFFSLILSVDGHRLAIRDAIGERPLYLMQLKTSTLIADRLSPLINHSDCSRTLNPLAISDFLSTGFVPFSRTPIKGISKLAPGAVASFQGFDIKIMEYHVLKDTQQLLTETESVEQVRAALNEAVANRFESSLKTGLLLSGGLDSSLVGALVGGQNLIASYSLSFGKPYRNELEFSGLMAKHLGIPQRVITVTPEMIKAKFLHTARVLDEPIGDPLTVPNIIVAEAAAQEVQLIFNGEGGDPVFGGPKNLPFMAFAAYGSAMPELTPEEMYLRSYNKGHEHLPTLLSADFKKQLQGGETTAQLMAEFLNYSGMESYLHRLLYVNLRLKGGSQILPKVFKASSAAGLLVRSPLFDRALVELAFSLPPAMKLKNSVEKYILKKAVVDLVPAAIIARPKSGMLVPVHFWFNKELKSFAREILLNKNAKTRHLFEPKELKQLLDFQGGGVKPYYGDRLWLLLSLELWMQAHNISAGF